MSGNLIASRRDGCLTEGLYGSITILPSNDANENAMVAY